MLRKALIVATVALAVMAAAGSSVRAGGADAGVVLEWNRIIQDTVPAPHNASDTALLLDGAHRHVRRDQRDRAGVHAVSCQVALRLRIAATRRPRRRRTTCSSPSTPAPRRLTARRSPASSETIHRASSSVVRQSARVSPGKCSRGARTTGGSCRRSRPTPSRRCPDAGSPRRQPTRTRPSRMCCRLRQWRCSRRRSICRRRLLR